MLQWRTTYLTIMLMWNKLYNFHKVMENITWSLSTHWMCKSPIWCNLKSWYLPQFLNFCLNEFADSKIIHSFFVRESNEIMETDNFYNELIGLFGRKTFRKLDWKSSNFFILQNRKKMKIKIVPYVKCLKL